MSCFSSPRVPDGFAIGLLARQFQDLGRGPHAEVGPDQRGFQLLQKIRIDLLSAGQHVLEPRDESRSRLLDAAS